MIVKDAFVFLIPLLILVLGAFALGMPIAGIFLLLLCAFVAFFFRNPRRVVPEDPKVIVSPADGRVVTVERVGNVTKLSIFLSIFNVHVNRSPMSGRIEAMDYRPGRFRAGIWCNPSPSIAATDRSSGDRCWPAEYEWTATR